MGKALYRAYRSRSFDELVGQDHIVTTLENSLKNKAISHAYLLTGPKGVGKTSVARILAYAVNDLDYHEDVAHLDVIEIDAASNRRIDEVREIRERVRIAPTSAKYKVYIIDEVHMLTREAFNALLKTLEEPPAHAIFILATTEFHKVPETIVSRCIRLTFKPIERTTLSAHLSQIAKKEGFMLDKEAVDLIADHAGGSFRDGISLLEQVVSSGEHITKKDVEHLLGIAPDSVVQDIMLAVESGSVVALQKAIEAAYAFGTDEATLASQLAHYCRTLLLNPGTSSLTSYEVIRIQRGLLAVAGSPKPRVELELVLLDILLERTNVAIQPKNTTRDDLDTTRQKTQKPRSDLHKTSPNAELPSKDEAGSLSVDASTREMGPDRSGSESEAVGTLGKPTKDDKPLKEDAKVHTESDIPDESVSKSTKAGTLKHDIWPALLDILKKRNNTLYGIARMGHVEQKGNTIEVTFAFPFHYKQVNDAKNKAIFATILSDISDGAGELVIRQSSNSATSGQPVAKKQDDTLKSVSNIFGGAEMLES